MTRADLHLGTHVPPQSPPTCNGLRMTLTGDTWTCLGCACEVYVDDRDVVVEEPFVCGTCRAGTHP
jgi:hypothetical protein